jgi:L-alanine-DL-glutamate epimerase-like enolase superfamily enzyme
MLGYSAEPDLVAERAKDVVDQGYTATKWFFAYGPSEGREGLRKNLEMIRTVRESVGSDVEIMFDAWNSFDVPYVQELARLSAAYRPWWFEEPVMPDMIDQYAELRRTVKGVAVAGGEHGYTRWGARTLLEAGAVDILQIDPVWAGGLTEMVKICALASARGIPVIPHYGHRASAHLLAAQTIVACPIQEWLIQHGVYNQHFLKRKIGPVDGYIDLPSGPGFDIVFDEAAIESREPLSVAQ